MVRDVGVRRNLRRPPLHRLIEQRLDRRRHHQRRIGGGHATFVLDRPDRGEHGLRVCPLDDAGDVASSRSPKHWIRRSTADVVAYDSGTPRTLSSRAIAARLDQAQRLEAHEHLFREGLAPAERRHVAVLADRAAAVALLEAVTKRGA